MTQLDKQETLRLELRKRAQQSLYFMAKAVLGFNKLASLHLSFSQFLQSTPGSDKLIIMPRGHYKTTITSISYPIFLTCNDTVLGVPGADLRLLIASSTSTNAQKILSVIRSKWERCELLRWLFPERVPDFSKVRWNDSCATLARQADWPEGTFEAIGAGGTAVSRHFDGILEDDLVNEDHLLSREQMDKVIGWHQYKESLFINPSRRINPLVGTRWAHYDLIQWSIDNEPFRHRYVRSAVENGVPIFPEEFTLQEFERLLTVMGTYKYSCQYLNDPQADTGRKFEEQWLRFYEGLPAGTYNYYIVIDPAASVFKAGGGAEVKDTDYSALVGIAVSTEGAIYVDDVVCARLGVDELIYELFRMVETYTLRAAGTAPNVGVETNAFQRALLFPIRQEMQRSGSYFHVTELKASSKSTKQLRILALQPYFSNSAIHVKRSHAELLHEYRLFPLAKHDDAMDALAYAVQMARPAQVPKEAPRTESPFSLESILASLPNALARNAHRAWHYHKPGSSLYAN